MKGLGFWLANGVVAASTALGANPPLSLDWGMIETSNEAQQSAFHLIKSSACAPVVQRLSSRGTAPWLVQFNGAVREEWKIELASAGAAIQGYMPGNGFLVEATPEAMARIAAKENVAWAGEYLPAYKKSKAAREVVAEARKFTVALFNRADKPRLAREFGEMGVFVSREEMQNESAAFRVRLSPEQVEEVANWGEVEWIERDVKPQGWGATVAAADSGEIGLELQQAFDRGERIYLAGRGIADAGSYGIDSRAIDGFVWEHPEMLVVAAAGNAAVDLNPADGVVDAGSVGSPATAKNALSVGAAEGRTDVARVWRDSWPEDFAVEPIALDRMAQADGPQGLAAFSGRGPCADGRIKPDLVAPGTFIVVPRPVGAADVGWGVAANTNEIYVGGTGVAAEQVADAARRVRQWLAEQRGLASPSAALVKALLVAGARDLAPGQYGTGPKQEIPAGRPNPAQGFGLLDVARAVQPGDGEGLDLHDAQGLAPSAADVYELDAGQAGGHFVLVLAYADFGAAPAAGKQLVNDLDLTVKTPSGAVLHANGRSGPDDVNNVEMIEFEADEAGAYLARVEARAVPMGGSQPYALVVRGPRTSAAPAATLETP